MLNDSYPLRDSYQAVNNAFSKQSFSFDEEDFQNPILQEMRKQVYEHVDKYITPDSNILELNAGTGIDALRFIQKGHRITATDRSFRNPTDVPHTATPYIMASMTAWGWFS